MAEFPPITHVRVGRAVPVRPRSGEGWMMELAVVGAGVGRTGTHSLKIALEQLLGAPCHHMVEILGDPTQIPAWTDAIEGRPVDWSADAGSLSRDRRLAGRRVLARAVRRESRRARAAVGPRSRSVVSQRVEHDLLDVRQHAARGRALDGHGPQAAPRPLQRPLRRPDRDDGRLRTPQRHASAPKSRPTGSSNGRPATDGNRSANGSGSRFPPSRSPSPTRPTSSAR